MHRPGEAELAERALRRALALDPRHRDARTNLGRLLARQRRWEDGVSSLSEGVRLHPYDVDLPFALALAEHRAGRSDEARRQLERVLTIDPRDEEARELLGSL